MASLVKNGDTYGLIWTDKSRSQTQTRESLKTDNKKQADRLKARLEHEYYHGDHDPWKRKWYEKEQTDSITIGNAVEKFILYKSRAKGKEGWGDTQAKNETWFMRMFAEFMGKNRLLDSLSKSDLEDFYFRDGINSNHSRNSNRISVNTFLNWAVDKGYLNDRPTYELKKPQTKVPKFIYVEELAELIKHRGLDRISLGWIILAGTGMRPVELVNLKRSHIERDGILIGEDFETKVKAERRIPFLFGVKEAIERLNGSDYLLGEKPSRAKDKLSRKFTKAWRAVYPDKPKRVLYNLKDTFCVRFLTDDSVPSRSGIKINDLKEIVGHTSLETTQKYLKAVPFGTKIEGTVWDYLPCKI